MRNKNRRKAVRIDNDPEGEASMPVRSTKEIAETHKAVKKANTRPDRPRAMDELGDNEEGKELFDAVLKRMASPDNQ